MFRRRYAQPRIDTSKKSWSIAFYFSIIIFIATIACSIQILFEILPQVDKDIIHREKWMFFLFGLIAACLVFANKFLRSLKTLLHELKHAAVVILSGNKMKDLRFSKNIGHVEYTVYQKKIRFMPFILLAPYHFPLFSLPALGAAITLEYFLMSFWPTTILGACLAIDLITAYQDLHPHQSDIRRIFGGRLIAYTYIIGANLFWLCICSIWIVAGNNGYIAAIGVLEKILLNLPTNIQRLFDILSI